MVSALLDRIRRWRLRRLRRKAYLLEATIALYREYPHHLGFEGLERVAAMERRLRRLQFEAGLIELRERIHADAGLARARARAPRSDGAAPRLKREAAPGAG